MSELSNLLTPSVLLAIILTVIFSELLKKADKKDRLKGYKVYFPAVLSIVFAFILAAGEFYPYKQVPFYAGVIFGFAVFCYEAIFKHLQQKIGSAP